MAKAKKKETNPQDIHGATEYTAFARDVRIGERVRIWGMPAQYQLLRRRGEEAVFASTWMQDPPEFRVGPRAIVEREAAQASVPVAEPVGAQDDEDDEEPLFVDEDDA